jgi:hypothetical protein
MKNSWIANAFALSRTRSELVRRLPRAPLPPERPRMRVAPRKNSCSNSAPAIGNHCAGAVKGGGKRFKSRFGSARTAWSWSL